MLKTLRAAAGVFNLIVPDSWDDDTVVGRILNTNIHAGEVRRLNAALEPDRADDGPEVEILTRR